MILSSVGRPHLTYCTNMHPGESWAEVRANVERYVLAVKALLTPAEHFGIGLRLSANAARSLNAPEELTAFRDFLDANGLYVFTINGFPYGHFHGSQVKDSVYLPDWLDDERRAYHDTLARILAFLLPGEPGLYGSVSTVPGAFARRVTSAEHKRRMADRFVDHAAVLYQIAAETGRVISLALEPEPCCFLETVGDSVAFFQDFLFAASSVDRLSELTGLDSTRSEEALRRHLGICLDACHAAVEFEDPTEAVATLRRAGIGVVKIQLSTGLRLPKVDAASLAALRPFAEDTYLHQVVARAGRTLTRYADLPEALDAAAHTRFDADVEWRVHFHVPIFMTRVGPFENTHRFLRDILEMQSSRPVSGHLEVETYTWNVLPPEHRRSDVVAAVADELRWVRERLER